MSGRFFGKVAVVLGGNSGIGLASAKAFAEEGAQVVITGRDPDTLLTAAQSVGHGTIALRSDISDLEQSSALFTNLRRVIGRVDVLFVNAGVLTVLSIESVSETAWDRVYDNNLKGAFFSVQAALPLMSRGSNVILNSSVAAYKGEAGVLVYATSKAGVRALGRSLAGELVERGIRVNVISPGLIYTPIFHRAHRIDDLPEQSIPTLLQKMSEKVPMKRVGTPEEVAAAVLFLASDAAAYITGVDLPIGGGAANL
jgi:NAD(P)-dependent dehydrogenase (short-subunit alcohol dehydrogenase family)